MFLASEDFVEGITQSSANPFSDEQYADN